MKVYKYIFIIIVSLAIVYFIVIKKNNDFFYREDIEKKTEYKKNIDVDFDFSKTILKPSDNNLVSVKAQNTGFYDEIIIPDSLEKVFDLIGNSNYEEALKEIERMEDLNELLLDPWLLYYKGHILFLQKKYSMAYKYLQRFIEEFPDHDMASNAMEAVKFIDGWYN